ncbi:hypothetical protein ACFLZW_04950 [Chloroflexota bacterium]
MINRIYRNGTFFIQAKSLYVLLAILFLCSACANTTSEPIPTDYLKIDPALGAYYDLLGGESVLGEVISPVIEEGQIKTQYVEAGKLVMDPQAPRDQLLRFYSLGREMGVTDPPVPVPEQPGLYHDGYHIIYPDFLPLYEQLGAEVVGQALSEMHFNPARRRYEQYFENIGFYRLQDTNEVHLLAYGVWACGDLCRSFSDSSNAIIDIHQYTDEVFVETHTWLADMLGFALSEAYINHDGFWEQIFENGVLVKAVGVEDSQVYLRPLAMELQVSVEPPRVKDVAEDGYFLEAKDAKGYVIPAHFWDYIATHGGMTVFGKPITHYAQKQLNKFRQCFTNMCLTYVPNAIESLRIRPEPLGYVYKLLFSEKLAVIITKKPAETITTVKTWEKYPALSLNQKQVIGIIVLSNYLPLEGIKAEFVMLMPNGARTDYIFPLTDANGQAQLILPLLQAQNGTLVEYQVCIARPSGEKFCVGESFIIWNNP